MKVEAWGCCESPLKADNTCRFITSLLQLQPKFMWEFFLLISLQTLFNSNWTETTGGGGLWTNANTNIHTHKRTHTEMHTIFCSVFLEMFGRYFTLFLPSVHMNVHIWPCCLKFSHTAVDCWIHLATLRKRLLGFWALFLQVIISLQN